MKCNEQNFFVSFSSNGVEIRTAITKLRSHKHTNKQHIHAYLPHTPIPSPLPCPTHIFFSIYLWFLLWRTTFNSVICIRQFCVYLRSGITSEIDDSHVTAPVNYLSIRKFSVCFPTAQLA